MKPQKKLSRKELNLKHDEFVDFTTRALITISEKKNQLLVMASALAVIILIVLGGLFLFSKYNEHADELLIAGWDQFNKTDEQGQVKREVADIEQAAKSFEQCFTKYSHSKAAAKALYLYGITQLHLNNIDGAESAFQKYNEKYATDQLQKEVAGLLASTYMERGDFQKAFEAYQQQSTKLEHAADISLNLLKQGICQYKLGKTEEARITLERVINEFTDSPWVTEAKDFLTLLPEQLAVSQPNEAMLVPSSPETANDTQPAEAIAEKTVSEEKEVVFESGTEALEQDENNP
ncbi:tetratricopeptide repeat protein [bacterium]|nr:tetratricopeptide repeat protein [bacterium]